jgi:glycosyltransferase involved in cell wall biosynthesis
LLKNILLITPHYPPSNLAAVHRSRLFAQHLPSSGWIPIILTVHEKFYEEQLDWNLFDLISRDQRIEKVKAFKITKPRVIGDIGLRGFFQLRRRALELIKSEKIDFVFIPIPSFYTALIGPYLFKKTGVKYGIDYIDPWVHQFPGSDKLFSRHWFSTQLAKFLEPIAVKHASLITGVSQGYFKPVLERNPHLKEQAISVAMPYGGEEADHVFIQPGTRDEGQGTREQPTEHQNSNILLPLKKDNIFRFVYAGAMLPKAYKPLEEIFKALQHNTKQLNDSTTQQFSFHFIGTQGTIKPLAEKYGLYGNIVFEHPARIPYLDVLKNLAAADGVFILGSTEPHYTPSKVYQGVLSQKPILAVLHQDSTAVKVLNESYAGQIVLMDGEKDLDTLGERFIQQFNNYLIWAKSFDPQLVNKAAFEQYSAKAVTNTLVNALNKVVL